MKTPVLIVSMAVPLLTATSQADLTYNAPGLPTPGKMSGLLLELSETVHLGHHWRYEITGYDWRIVAGNPTGALIKTDGTFTTLLGSLFTATTVLRSTIEGDGILTNATLLASHKDDEASESHTFNTPMVYKDQAVSINFIQISNMLGDEGSFLNLHGVAIKDPPVPTGEITITDIVREGATPNINWSIKREGTTGTANNVVTDSSLLTLLWDFTLSPGQTSANVNVITPPTSEVTDSSNVGVNVSINPEDVSASVEAVIHNPLLSAQLWGDTNGMIEK